MKTGDKVTWKYVHYLNCFSCIHRIKKGIFIRKVRHYGNHRGKQLALVQFEGNKKHSTVGFDDLIKEAV